MMPNMARTQVDRVKCYYLGRRDKRVEIHDLHGVDFRQAQASHPDDWSLEPPPGPEAMMIDKREVFVFPQPQPPAHQAEVPMQPDRIQSTVGRVRGDSRHDGGPGRGKR